MPRTFDEFVAAVKDSCEGHARRKNYTSEGVDGDNQLLRVCTLLNIHTPHAIGEIIYKCAEYLRTPRSVLLEKIAGWAFILWRELDPESSIKGVEGIFRQDTQMEAPRNGHK